MSATRKIQQAIKELNPDAEFIIRSSTPDTATVDGIEWFNGTTPIPTTEITQEITRLQAEYDLLAYSRSRKAEYPSIEECIHAILDDDLTALQVKRQAVKDKYPKGSN